LSLITKFQRKIANDQQRSGAICVSILAEVEFGFSRRWPLCPKPEAKLIEEHNSSTPSSRF